MDFLWVPQILTASCLGIILGTLGIWQLRKERSDSSLSEALHNSEESFNHRIAMLRDLESQKQRLTKAYYHTAKTNLEQQAAKHLKKREEMQTKLAEASARNRQTINQTTPGFLKRTPQLAGFFWGVGLCSLIGGLVWSVGEQAAPRAPMMQSPTNSPPPSNGGGEVQAQLEFLKQNPNDVDAMVKLTRTLLLQQMFSEAQALNQRALEINPEHVGAKIQAAVLLGAQGDTEGALNALVVIGEAHPDAHDTWFFQGMLKMQSGDKEGMKISFRKFVETAPKSPRRDRIQQMLSAMTESSTPSATGNN
ncbi:MAG: tetratricopeptide repeat protein [Myxococcota bacterium]|nr:tetratricopeptide repeat protein [Myxococcota bacterium]